MKRFFICTIWSALTLQGMQTEQYLPYQSDYVIESRTRDITNPEHKSIVAGFMQRCCWIPEPTTILWIGNQITNGGFYNPQEFFEILKMNFLKCSKCEPIFAFSMILPQRDHLPFLC